MMVYSGEMVRRYPSESTMSKKIQASAHTAKLTDRDKRAKKDGQSPIFYTIAKIDRKSRLGSLSLPEAALRGC